MSDDVQTPGTSTPDSVRLALPREAADIAGLQRRSWADELGGVGGALLDNLALDEMVGAWHEAITRPPLAACRVLVCVEQDKVVGFATTLPSDDPDATPGQDGLISEFIIDPTARGRGHGSRLLNACVDTLRADGFSRAALWLRSTDDATREFVTSSGWATDGSHREIGTEDDGTRIKQVRLHSDISA
ncbi:GNAT family N-acetyltransferase [Mariniluteicoccus flavus]